MIRFARDHFVTAARRLTRVAEPSGSKIEDIYRDVAATARNLMQIGSSMYLRPMNRLRWQVQHHAKLLLHTDRYEQWNARW